MNIYRNFQILRWSLFAVAIIAAGLLNVFLYIPILHDDKSIITTLTLCVFLAAAIIPPAVYLRSRMRRISDVLFKDCDPEKYNELTSILVQKTKGSTRIWRLLELSYGLLCQGKYMEARAALENIPRFEATRTGRMQSMSCQLLLFMIHLGLKDLGNAEMYLKEFKRMIFDINMVKEKQRPALIKTSELAQASLDIAKGNFENAEQIFLEETQRSISNLTKVISKYTLGEIYMHYKRFEEAREAFEYIVAHGNKLYMVEQAREKLESLAEQ